LKESGATTHILRPGWSPDGSMIVSAHSMNGGGPTAQIVERSSWRCNKDFVGHKKAVSCVRFNSRVFEKSNKDNGKTEMFNVVALGSRDRSFSVWTSILQRPFFVVNDAFDQGILDLSWSRDGRVLLACSMDGSVAAIILSPDELGKPIPESRLYDLMRTTYGKNYGTIANLKTSSANLTNGGPVVIENPDMLKRDDAKSATTNGHDIPRANSNSCSSSKSRLYPPNPTDKQIEARTADGRRRITPIFIPVTTENGSAEPSASRPFGISEFGSSSTQERSRIEIEKREDIVRPNISPGKRNENSDKTDVKEEDKKPSAQPQPKSSQPSAKPSAKPEEPKVNMVQVKKKPSTPTQKPKEAAKPDEPKVNIIQIKKKPGPASQQQQQAPVASPPKASSPPMASKKRKRVMDMSDSSDEDDDDNSGHKDLQCCLQREWMKREMILRKALN